MGWQRFNRTSRVFEVSDDNGASWQVLKIAAEGTDVVLPSNIAYTNVNNAFSAAQDFAGGSGTDYTTAPIEIAMVSYPRVSFHWPGVVATNLGMDGAGSICAWNSNLTAFAVFRCGALYAGRTYLGEALTQAYGAYLYPGSITGEQQQAAWYLGSHSSYGLYSNTGFYQEGGIWTNAVESRNHVRAVAGLYDYNRGTPIGNWTAFTISIGGGTINSSYGAGYTLIGKTCIIDAYFNATLNSGLGNYFYILLPFGAAGQYAATAFPYHHSTIGPQIGMAQISPANASIMYFYRDALGTVNWPAGSIQVAVTFPIQIA